MKLKFMILYFDILIMINYKLLKIFFKVMVSNLKICNAIKADRCHKIVVVVAIALILV